VLCRTIVEVIQAGKPRITYGNVTVERVGELVQSIKTGKVLTDLAIVRHDEEAYCLNITPLKYAKEKYLRHFPASKNTASMIFLRTS